MTLMLEFCVAAWAGALFTELLRHLHLRRKVLKYIMLTESIGMGVKIDHDWLIFRFPRHRVLILFIWVGIPLGLSVALLLLAKFVPAISVVSHILVFPLIIFWLHWLLGSGWHLPYSTYYLECAQTDWQQLKIELGEFDRCDLTRPEVQKAVRLIVPKTKIVITVAPTCLLVALMTTCLHTAHVAFIVATVLLLVAIIFKTMSSTHCFSPGQRYSLWQELLDILIGP